MLSTGNASVNVQENTAFLMKAETKPKYMLSLASDTLFMMCIKIGSAISNKQKRAHTDLST